MISSLLNKKKTYKDFIPLYFFSKCLDSLIEQGKTGTFNASSGIKITVDDWIFKQDGRVAINRATMTKFGFKVAELTVMFVKD